ncbi:hypothetical protein MBLNU13_g10068t1 [Cladosporium sp. NU13]
MAPIALDTKHQDLLKVYIQVPKTSGADSTTIATKADYLTSKYARDQWSLVKSKLLATDNGAVINLADRQIALLKATIEVMKTETDWEKVASVANVKTSKYARDQFAIIRNKLCGGGKVKSDTASPSRTPTKPKATKSTKATPSRKRKTSEDGASQPSASADEVSTPKAKKNKKTRKVKVEETEAEEDEGGEEPVAPVAQEQQADAHNAGKLEPESDAQEESFFEAEMFDTG